MRGGKTRIYSVRPKSGKLVINRSGKLVWYFCDSSARLCTILETKCVPITSSDYRLLVKHTCIFPMRYNMTFQFRGLSSVNSGKAAQ